MSHAGAKQRTLRWLVLMFVYWIVASLCLHSFMERWSFREASHGFNLGNMLSYSAPRPFAYRALMPMLINATADIIPAPVKEKLQGYLGKFSHAYERYFQNGSVDAWTPDYQLKYHIAYFYDFAFLLATMLALRALLRACYPSMIALAETVPVVFVLLLPPVYMQGGYLYDFPELFFLAACFYAAFTGRLWMLVLLLPLAVLNKESNILLPLLLAPMLLIRRQVTTLAQGAVIVAAMAMAAAAFVGTHIAFAHNSGDEVQRRFVDNLHFWSTLRPYLDFTTIYAAAIPFPKPQTIFFLPFVVLLASYRWSHKPRWLQWTLLVAVVVNLPLLILFGKHDETRNLSLMFVPLCLVCSHSLALLYNRDPTPEVAVTGRA